MPRSRQDGADRRAARVTQDIQKRYEALSHMGPDKLKELVEAHSSTSSFSLSGPMWDSAS